MKLVSIGTEHVSILRDMAHMYSLKCNPEFYLMVSIIVFIMHSMSFNVLLCFKVAVLAKVIIY